MRRFAASNRWRIQQSYSVSPGAQIDPRAGEAGGRGCSSQAPTAELARQPHAWLIDFRDKRADDLMLWVDKLDHKFPGLSHRPASLGSCTIDDPQAGEAMVPLLVPSKIEIIMGPRRSRPDDRWTTAP
jgi:hypothetical protein